MKEELARHHVKLLGGGLDEAPFAYKDIEVVMQSQKALVDVVGKFTPKIVKMCGDAPRQWRKKRRKGKRTAQRPLVPRKKHEKIC